MKNPGKCRDYHILLTHRKLRKDLDMLKTEEKVVKLRRLDLFYFLPDLSFNFRGKFRIIN